MGSAWFLAVWLEQNYTKEEILELYMNRVYFGAGATGIEAAAQTYFGISARNLSLGQAAMLAGILPAPSAYNPKTNPERAAKYFVRSVRSAPPAASAATIARSSS